MCCEVGHTKAPDSPGRLDYIFLILAGGLPDNPVPPFNI